MSNDVLQIKRYPNRRFYARHLSKYVSLQEIEAMIQAGHTVEIRDSQSDENITRLVLTQIIVDRQPEKMSLFPAEMLHFIVRSNDVMTEFLRDYFRHSLTYLEYMHRHSAAAKLAAPMHWVKAWLDGIGAKPAAAAEAAPAPDMAPLPNPAPAPPEGELAQKELAQKIERLEARLRELEAKGDRTSEA